MKRITVGACLAAAAAGFCATQAQAAETYSIWDNFNGASALNPDLWLGLERTRQLGNGVANFTQRDIGTQAGDSTATWASWGMGIQDGGQGVTQMRAVVALSSYDVIGCAANTTYATMVQARLVGEFFNATGNSAGGGIDDVGAVIRLFRSSTSSDPTGTLRVQGVAYRCTTTDCNTPEVLGTADLGTTSVNVAETLRLEWEPDQNRFNFQRGTSPKQSVGYSFDDSHAPVTPFKQIGTRTQVASCLTGARGSASVSAKFDNFSVNNSAVTP